MLLIFISLLTSYFLKIAHCLAKKCKSFACLFYFVFSVFHYSQTKFGSASSVVSELFVCKTVQQISLIVRIKFSLQTFSFLDTLGRLWPNFRQIFHFHHKNKFQKNCVIHISAILPLKRTGNPLMLAEIIILEINFHPCVWPVPLTDNPLMLTEICILEIHFHPCVWPVKRDS